MCVLMKLRMSMKLLWRWPSDTSAIVHAPGDELRIN